MGRAQSTHPLKSPQKILVVDEIVLQDRPHGDHEDGGEKHTPHGHVRKSGTLD